jgi:glycosyltransferase involved in cell wall biosynthesis
MFGMWGMNVPGRHFAGFESAFSIVGPRLVEMGHEVTIYCRRGEYAPELRRPEHEGVKLVFVPSPGGKNFSGLLATLFSVLHALVFRRFDVYFFVNVGMGHHCALARLFGRKVALNVDGLDWRRDKWGRFGKAYFYSAARMAVRVCNRLVTDAEGMRAFYREHFGVDSTMIAYGASVERSTRPDAVRQYGVEPGEYYLIVSRLIPENHLDVIMEGYRQSGTRRKLVVVGSANYESEFHQRLRELATDDVVFTGHVHDQSVLSELWCNALGYFHGHSVGGTNPALLRAMGCGALTIAHDNVFNREVLDGAGRWFFSDAAEVAARMAEVEALDTAERARVGEVARERIATVYTWERITAQYEALFREMAGA